MYIFSPSTIISSSEVNSNFQEALGNAGDIIMTGRTTAPSGWLLCQGQAVSRVTYAALFNAIGTTYGIGNGSTTFNLPDLRGRVPIGLDSGYGPFDTLGDVGGALTSSIAHTHTYAHTHKVYVTGIEASFSNAGGSQRQPNENYTLGHYAINAVELTSYAQNTATSSAMSANGTPSIVQPFQIVNYIIKI